MTRGSSAGPSPASAETSLKDRSAPPNSHVHMRLSVPNIPRALLNSTRSVPFISDAEAVDRISKFLSHGNVAVLTGAGISVDSGIKAYRGKDGRYMNPDYRCVTQNFGSANIGIYILSSRPIFVSKLSVHAVHDITNKMI